MLFPSQDGNLVRSCGPRTRHSIERGWGTRGQFAGAGEPCAVLRRLRGRLVRAEAAAGELRRRLDIDRGRTPARLLERNQALHNTGLSAARSHTCIYASCSRICVFTRVNLPLYSYFSLRICSFSLAFQGSHLEVAVRTSTKIRCATSAELSSKATFLPGHSFFPVCATIRTATAAQA